MRAIRFRVDLEWAVRKLFMTRTYANSILERESPQYAHVLAILSGGIAYIIPQLGAPIAAWLSYALLAALFGFIWPYRALQWGGWLCLPMILLISFEVILTWNLIGAILSNGIVFVEALSSACLGAYIGAKLSVRKIANRSTNKRVSRKRLNSNGNGARSSLIAKELASPIASVKTNFSTHNSNNHMLVAAPLAHIHDLDTAVIKAAQEGDLRKIRLLVADGADVNAESGDQWTPLMIAAQGFDIGAVKTLFTQGAALDTAGGNGWTALMIATIEGQVEVVRALLEQGAQVNSEHNKGWTALRFAISMDETEILRLLLDAGADANIADHEGKTALMQAAGENIKESLKALLDAGADPHIKDHNGQTALMIAQKQGQAEIVKLLKEAEAKASTDIGAPVNILDNDSSNVVKTHRVIKIPRDQYYGLLERYDVIPRGISLPYGCEETGLEGNEEECWNNAWKSNIGEPAELGWWLRFNS